MKHSSGISAVLAAVCLVLGLSQADAREEVIVTTRNKAENLQDVPIAIDAISAVEIERLGLSDLRSIAQLSPSVQYTTAFSANDTQVVIRGLRPTRGRVNAAVLLDGVDISSESIGTFGGSLLIDPELYALERIEIVKGPQNALYGRSAFNGAISYITRAPSDDFEADVSADVGDYGRFKTTGRVSGPLVDGVLFGGIDAMYHTHDGYHRNVVTGGDRVGDSDGFAVSGDLRWAASDNLNSRLKLSYSDDDIGLPPWRFMDPNYQFPIPQSAIDAGVVPAGFPDADTFGTATVAELLDQPGILDLEPGFVPGPLGLFPSGDQPGATMGVDPRTCTDPNDGSTCSGYADGSREVFRGQLNIDWDVGGVTLTSISHYADSTVKLNQDANAIGSAYDLPFLSEIRYVTDTELLSQELRVSSNSGGVLNWTLGGLYWSEKVDQVDTGNSCFAILHPLAPQTGGFPPFSLPPIPNTPCGPFQADIGPQGSFPTAREVWFRDTDHWSAYFRVDWNISETLTLDLEGRYVNEDMDVGGPDADTVVDPLGLGYNSDLFGAQPDPDTGLVNGCVPWPPLAFPGSLSCINPRPTGVVTASEDDSYFLPKATLTWRIADGIMSYASVAKAAKPAGIAALTGGPGAFNPEGQRFDREEKTTYELGAKTQWLDQSLTVNGAIFYDDYSDKQVTTQVPDPSSGLLVPSVENAAKATILGFEIEAAWAPIEDLLLTFGYTFLDAEYDDFVQLTGSTGTIAYGGNCTPITDPGGKTVCGVDFSGNDLEFAPRNAIVASAAYSRPLGGELEWFVQGDGSFTDKRYVAANSTLALDEYWLFNLRAGLGGQNWEFMAYLNNVFDDDTPKEGLDNIDSRYVAFGGGVLVPNGARYLLPDPRTVGVRLSYRFGQ